MQRLKHYLVPAQGKFHIDFLSGLTVALALIPEAIAFALVAHVSPLVGLYAAFFMCFIAATLGGRPGMISGATGSMRVCRDARERFTPSLVQIDSHCATAN